MVIAKTHGLLFPLVRPAILDRDRDRARFGPGSATLFRSRIVTRCIVVEYGLPLTSTDIQPSTGAAELAKRVAEAGGKKLRVVRQSSVYRVAPGTFSVVDFFLFGKFLVNPRLHRFLCPARSKPRQRDDDRNGQARRRPIPCFRRHFD